MKQNKLSILFPYQDEVTYREIPEESWHDLGLDALTEKVASQPQEVPLLRRVMMSLTADPRVAAFRSDVFEDILRVDLIADLNGGDLLTEVSFRIDGDPIARGKNADGNRQRQHNCN